jgi:hypothetical protein
MGIAILQNSSMWGDKRHNATDQCWYNIRYVTSQLFRKSFNCRDNPRMDYAFCLLTLKSSEEWRSPLFGKKGKNLFCFVCIILLLIYMCLCLVIKMNCMYTWWVDCSMSYVNCVQMVPSRKIYDVILRFT